MSHNTYFCHIRFYGKFDFMSKLKQKFSVFSKSTQMSFRPSRIEVTTFLIESICHKNNLSNKLQWLPRPLKCFFFSFLFYRFLKNTSRNTSALRVCLCLSLFLALSLSSGHISRQLIYPLLHFATPFFALSILSSLNHLLTPCFSFSSSFILFLLCVTSFVFKPLFSCFPHT